MVSIFTITNRKQFMDNVLKNYKRQRLDCKELIVVLNDDSMNVNEWDECTKSDENISVYQLPKEMTLGECCNFAIEKAKYELIAKFDDDDYYAANYLAEDIKAFQNPDVQITGKHKHYIYFKKMRLLAENDAHPLSPLLGATLIFRKELTKKVRFRPLNVGEDTEFLNDCKYLGYNLHYSHKYNYVYIRYDRNHHTWKAPQKKLLRTSEHICYTDDYRPFIEFKAD